MSDVCGSIGNGNSTFHLHPGYIWHTFLLSTIFKAQLERDGRTSEETSGNWLITIARKTPK